MNTSVTSREAILETCRQLVSERGISALNMRLVAESCHVALGSLYYYFPSKNELLLATIESVWEDIFRLKKVGDDKISFVSFIESTFDDIQIGMQKYPNFFTMHSMSISSEDRSKGRSSMSAYFGLLKERMAEVLASDSKVRKDIFSDEFREVDFIDFVLSHIMYLLITRSSNCQVLLQVINRLIYP